MATVGGMQAKGVADAGSAAFRVSGLELGGLFGSLLAGRISDALIARDPKGGNCGKRVQVNFPTLPLCYRLMLTIDLLTPMTWQLRSAAGSNPLQHCWR